MPAKSNQYKQLVDKWTNKHRDVQKDIFDKHGNVFEWLTTNSKQLAIGSAAGLFLLSTPIIPQIKTSFYASNSASEQNIDKKVFLIYDLKNILPSEVRPLTADEEQKVGEILSRNFNMKVAAELSGIRLNTSYGYIGQEQHLARFPGDTMFTHFETTQDANNYWDYGMAPGLGAWRYFADSKDSMTREESDREKYYIAVQTFLSPGFSDHVREYMEFFKYRKMLVVNPQNGKAIIADIADSGPAKWTNKQLGGSPEVMRHLERVDGVQKGPVLYYFIDDPNNEIPLGPINL